MMRKLGSVDAWMDLKVKTVTDVKQDITTFPTAELVTVILQGQTLQPSGEFRVHYTQASFIQQMIQIKNLKFK